MKTSSARTPTYVAILICATGCAGALDNRVEVQPEAASIRLVNAIGPKCKQLGDVIGTADAEGDQAAATEGARNDLRNKAYDMQATDVLLQTAASNRKAGVWGGRTEITISGVAYRCPGAPE
jgi:hypothetical protein